jgi:hypothetical protein
MLCPRGYRSPPWDVSADQPLCVKCEAGQFIDVEGSTRCLTCESGTYSAQQGSEACAPCPAAFACESSGTSAPVSCDDVRFVCPQGTRSPVLIPAGEFRVTAAATSPCPVGQACVDGVKTPCDAGYITSTPGAAVCTACAPGSYERNRTECVYCSIGTYQDEWSATDCKPCVDGRYATTRGASRCEACEASFECNATSQMTCPPGHYCPSQTPAGSALRCPVNTYREAMGGASLGDCTACPIGAVTDGEIIALSVSMCTCGRGFIDTRTHLSQDLVCEVCPQGAVCDSVGVSIRSMELSSGYWREWASRADPRLCDMPKACKGGALVTNGSLSGSDALWYVRVNVWMRAHWVYMRVDTHFCD